MTLPGKTRNLKPPANPPSPRPPMPPASVTPYKGPRPWDERSIHFEIPTTDPHQSLVDAVNAAPQLPCYGCDGLTGTRASVPGRPDLGTVPLHLRCSALALSAMSDMSRGERPHPIDFLVAQMIQDRLGVRLIELRPKPVGRLRSIWQRIRRIGR